MSGLDDGNGVGDGVGAQIGVFRSTSSACVASLDSAVSGASVSIVIIAVIAAEDKLLAVSTLFIAN